MDELRKALDHARHLMLVVATSPVCHPHNAIALRDEIARVQAVLDRVASDA